MMMKNCQEDKDPPVVEQICELYEKISKLESLKPSKDVNTLLSELVSLCIRAGAGNNNNNNNNNNNIDVSKLCIRVQQMRHHLIKMCGEAEGHLESHFSTILASSYDNPLDHLSIFPYFDNYTKLSQLEFDILAEADRTTQQYYKYESESKPEPEPDQYIPPLPLHLPPQGPQCRRGRRIAFVGSGPLPLTSICLALFHFTTDNTTFHNYDVDPSANSMASKLITKSYYSSSSSSSSSHDLSKRMFFHTCDIMDAKCDELKSYDVVFLAALVGMDKEDKVRVIKHLGTHMSPGAILMLRSAHGAKAFLYPVIDPSHLSGFFDLLFIYHPTDDVINSVIVARKIIANINATTTPTNYNYNYNYGYNYSYNNNNGILIMPPSPTPTPPTTTTPTSRCKCSSDYQPLLVNPLNHGNI